MTIGSDTASLHTINIAIVAADGSKQHWQDPAQMIPWGMYGNPEQFVASLRSGLPLVNNLRILFNEYSFNADGSLNPQFERFLEAATAAGFHLTLTYGSGDNQNLGIGDADHPSLTNAQAYDALGANFSDVEGAWVKMMDWMDGHSTVKSAVYGWDMMNEAAGYSHSVEANGADATYDTASFVSLYATHCAELAKMIEARADGHILVGGWGYNGDFQTLANSDMGSGSALDYLRASIGTELVWSAHLYPGWMGTGAATNPTDLMAQLDRIYAPLQGDNLLMTETNINGSVDDVSQPIDANDLFAASAEWFAQNGVGMGWYPAAQTGASSLIYVEKDGGLTLRHQHSFAHAMNTFSLTEVQPAHDGAEQVALTLTTMALRNEDYEVTAGEAQFDTRTQMGIGFGFGGADTLTGAAQSNDFLYGGAGNDLLTGSTGDDFLFGQGDNDKLYGGDGIDHLFGGLGADTLDGGAGSNLLAGGAGNDLYFVRTSDDRVQEYANGGVDRINTTMHAFSLATATQYANIENLDYTGSGSFRGTGNGLNNHIWGGAGDDTLFGGAGADTLEGGGGTNRYYGGAGVDCFIFGKGQDVIFDFADDVDRLVFRKTAEVQTLADLQAHASDVAGSVVFDFGADGMMSVRGITLAALSDNLVLQ